MEGHCAKSSTGMLITGHYIMSEQQQFKKLGEPLVFGKGPYNIGSLWIYNPLEYNQITDNQRNTVVEILSTMLQTSNDFLIKESAAFHYCKLHSPPRAMEWIYIDSLKLHNSLKNQQEINIKII